MSAVLTSRTFKAPIPAYVYTEECVDDYSRCFRCERVPFGTYDMCICYPHVLYPCNIDFCASGSFRLEDGGEARYIVNVWVLDRDYDEPCHERLKYHGLKPLNPGFYVKAVIGLNLHHVMVSEPEA